MHQFLVQRRAEPVGEAAVDLPLDYHRIEDRAHIVDRNVFDDLHSTGGRVEFDRGEIGDKAVGHGRSDAVGIVRTGEHRRIEHHALVQPGADVAGHAGRIPVGARSEASNGNRARRLRLQPRRSAGQFDLSGRHLELVSRHRLQLVGHLLRTDQYCAAHRGSEAVGVVARGDAPGGGARIEFGQHVDVVRTEAQFRGDDLSGDGRVSLTVRRAVQVHAHRSARVDGDGGRGIAPGFRFGAAALLGRLRQADIGHVRAGRLDADRETDTEQPAATPRVLARLEQRRVVGEPQGLGQATLVVSGVEHRARRTGIGKFVFAHQVPAPDLGRVDVEAARRHFHQALEREVELRPAVAAVESRRHAIGHHQHVLYRDVLHAVGAVRGGVHAIDRGRLGCADVSAEVDDIAKTQTQQLALVRERPLDAAGAVGSRGRSHQVLEPVFGPLHRHAHQAARGRHQHHVGEDRLLDAETAA